MSAIILHLSDIHIDIATDSILGRSHLIAACLNPYLPDATSVIIVVSGDIARSGRSEEYEHAKPFFEQLMLAIMEETKVPVEILIAPGNHDCDLRGDLSVRESVLKTVLESTSAVTDAFVAEATSVQSQFINFRDSLINRKAIVFEDPLWITFQFDIEGLKVIFDVLNASWMSVRHEQQGGILFPFERYHAFKSKDADLRIVVLHHPLNWYNKKNYLDFRAFIRSLSDILISGHEHQSNAGLIDDAISGECAFIEGAALQEQIGNSSGFNIVVINPAEKKFACEKYSWDGARYISANEGAWFPIRALPKRSASELAITDDFKAILTDPGATLRHPDKRELVLDDIYIYPDLGRLSRT